MGFLLEDGPGPILATVLVRYRKLPTQFFGLHAVALHVLRALSI
jgi:hypothetical protein